MSWDARSERITAKAEAAKTAAEAEAIRAQAAADRAQADDERAARAEQRKAERRAERRKRRADQRAAIAGRIRRYAVPVAAIGSPEVIAWAGQYGFGAKKMHLGVLAPLLPVALEGGVLYSATLALEAVDAGKPAGRYRAATWIQAGIAAALNYWHGSKDGADVGVALALTSLLGIVMLELTVALKRHKNSGRSAEQIRTGLIRRARYPRLSLAAAAIAAARNLDAEEAWQAAWIDRYGIGPDSTRRDRRTARVILARQQHADRKAAKAGHLTIVDGAIVRPAPEPAETLAPGPDLLIAKTEMQAALLADLVDTEKIGEGVFTKAEMQAAILADLLAATTDTETLGPELFSDEALAAWLNGGEPPIQGLTSPTPAPDTGGSHGAAHDVPGDAETEPTRPAHIDGDQRRGGDGSGSVRGLRSAAEARRARGEQTRRRIAEHMAAHPDHTVEQIAKALDMSPATVKRHRRAIRNTTRMEIE